MRKTINNQNPSRVNVFGGGVTLNKLLLAVFAGCMPLGAQAAGIEPIAPAPISETVDNTSSLNSVLAESIASETAQPINREYGAGSHEEKYKFNSDGLLELVQGEEKADVTIKYEEKSVHTSSPTGDLNGTWLGDNQYGSAVSLYSSSTPDNINIDGIFAANKSNSGAAITVSGANVGTITGDFIGNCVNQTSSGNNYASGGAIYLSSGSIQNLKGSFYGNMTKVTESGQKAHGGAIYLTTNTTIHNIEAYFANNSAISTGTGTKSSAHGGAIDNIRSSDAEGVMGGTIYSIKGVDFIVDINGKPTLLNGFYNNTANAKDSGKAHGGAIHNEGEIWEIIADFTSNSAITEKGNARGGAIWLDDIIKSIKGNFVGNYVKATSATGDSNVQGGAIYAAGYIGNDYLNHSGKSKGITGNFINNYVVSEGAKGSDAQGGAIYSKQSIGFINGNFIGNYAEANGTGTIARNAQGGAICHLDSSTSDDQHEIGYIIGDFINNHVKSVKGFAQGGAIYNTDNIGTYAEDGTWLDGEMVGSFFGNYAQSTSGRSQGGAIYNEGRIGKIVGVDMTLTDEQLSAWADKYIESSHPELVSGSDDDKIAQAKEELLAQVKSLFAPSPQPSPSGGEGEVTFNGFFGNYAQSTSSAARGGAIYNGETIGDITGDFIGNYAKTSGGAIYNGETIGDITGDFIGNYAKTSGGAIYNSGTIGDITGNFIGNYAKTSGGAIYNEGNLTIAEGTSFINNHVKSVYESRGGAIWTNKDLTLTNQLFTGNYAKANMDKAQGGAIYSEADLTFNADNVDILMKGNYVQIGENKDPEAIYMGTKDKTLTLNATNGGKIQFDDKINGTDERYNLTLTGGDAETDSIILNNNITNANATLTNATLTIGLTDLANHQSDVFKNSSLDVQSGIVTTADSQYSNYNFGKLTSSGDARYVIDMELSKFNQKADTFTVGEGSDGKVHLKRINVIVGDDEHPELVPDDEKEYVVQIIKAKKGEKAPELYYDGAKPLNHAHAHMTNDEILAKGFELYTTDTHFDSILLRGWKDNLAAWAEFEPDPKDEDQTKSFTFTDSSEHTLTRDIDELRGKDLTLKGAGNNLNLQGHNLFEHIGDGQNVSVSDLNIKNGTPIENDGNLTLDSVGMGEEVEITNDGVLNLKGKMDIIPEIHNNNETNIVDGEITLNSKVDGEGDLNIKNSEVGIYGTVQDQHITHSDSNTTLYNVEGFKGNDLVMESGNFNVPQLGMHELHLGEFALNGGNVNIDNVDVDLANKKMGRITADEYTSEDPKGTIYVGDMNLLSDNDALVTPVEFADKAIKDNVKSGVTFAPTPGQRHDVYSPLFRYDVEYSADGTYGENGYFVFKRHGGSSYESYNPAVLASDVYTQAAGQSAITETYRYVFEHADAFTQLPEATRMAQINADKYALSTDFNDNLGSLCYEHGDDANKAGWVRPYTTFETISLHNGPKVDAITYGTLIGYDTNFRHLKHGWTNVGTGYLGYMGSQLNYSGIDTNMNGGLLGLTETFYKGNFWTAITASVGAGVANTTTSYGHDDTAMIMGGIASKSGYNFEFKEGRYILQPIWQMSYTFVNSFDYTNAAGVRIDSDPSHSIQLNPKLRFIMNTKRGWQPYASVGMVWNLVTHSNSTANGYALPEMNVKPFVEYGLGLQRSWNDKFTAFGQVMLRNGGRTGVALTAGFRWALGRDDDNKNYHQHKHEKVENTINKKQPAVSMQTGGRKIIKQMDYAQKAAFKTKNTSRTTYRATIKSLL